MWILALLLVAGNLVNCMPESSINSPEPIITNLNSLPVSIKIPVITSEKFQLDFLMQIGVLIDDAAHKALNQYLETLQQDSRYAEMYASECEKMKDPTTKLSRKIIFIKQLLDLKNDHQTNIDEQQFYILRNVNFLKKLKHRMTEIFEETGNDLRLLRMYSLCRQFEVIKSKQNQEESQIPYSRHTKLSPLMENVKPTQHITETIAHNYNSSIDITEFGKNLYENVKQIGAEVIDEFLYSLRKLLHEVIEEKSEDAPEISKLRKFIREIDIILSSNDFYDKRQKLYTYLQSNLATDFEQLKEEESDLANIFNKLKEKGLNVFVAFLFSNFEFLDHLHAEWKKLLPTAIQREHPQNIQYYDENVQLLANITRLYDEFKKDNENEAKYEAYIQKVKLLQQKHSRIKGYAPIFDILHNASLNVGSVTMNIIRAKCEET